MKFNAKMLATILRVVLLLAVILAVAVLPCHLTNNKTYAQSEAEEAPATAIPSLTAQATESGVLLTWHALPEAVRYELLTYWASDPG